MRWAVLGLAFGIPLLGGGAWMLAGGGRSGLVLVAEATQSEGFYPRPRVVALPPDPEPVDAPPMPVLPVPPGGTYEQVLGTWTTRFARFGEERDRAHNVRLAADALDRAVIPAGGELSFNGRVGERSYSAGYREATVLMRGERVDGVGGGACQVASTLHAAAFFAGLDVVEQSPHSRPSSYVAMGLDATVTWGGLDLVVRNPFPFPVLVRVAVEGNALRVDLLGREQVRTVEWRRRVLERTEHGERVVHDPSLAMDAREVDEGSAGFLVRRTRVLTDAGRTWTEERLLRYPPADTIVRTGDPFPKDAPAQLPPS